MPTMADTSLHLPRAVMGDDEREAFATLSRVHGPGELRATVLALLLTPGSQRERRAWQDETRGLSTAKALRDTTKHLSRASRLPWLERLLQRLAGGHHAACRSPARAARRRPGSRRGSTAPGWGTAGRRRCSRPPRR